MLSDIDRSLYEIDGILDLSMRTDARPWHVLHSPKSVAKIRMNPAIYQNTIQQYQREVHLNLLYSQENIKMYRTEFRTMSKYLGPNRKQASPTRAYSLPDRTVEGVLDLSNCHGSSHPHSCHSHQNKTIKKNANAYPQKITQHQQLEQDHLDQPLPFLKGNSTMEVELQFKFIDQNGAKRNHSTSSSELNTVYKKMKIERDR